MKTLDDYLFTYFISACNFPGEMLGVIDCGMDWGCAVNEIRPQWELGIQYTLDSDVLAFFDSGAVSEFKFDRSGKQPPKLKYPITDKDWLIRLNIYLWVAERLGDQAYLVAPDQVTSQGATLNRLARYADIMQECRERGANIVVAHQGGQLSLELFTHEATAALGFDDFIVGFPMREMWKGGPLITPLPVVRSYCDLMAPRRVHLLGLGPKRRRKPRFVDVLEAIDDVSPDTEVFADSAMLQGMIGKTGDARTKTRKLRPLTIAQHESMALLRERLHGRDPDSMRYEDVLNDPRHYVGHVRWRLLVEAWAEDELIPEADIAYGLEDPAGLLARGRLFDNPRVRSELDTEWRLVTDDRASQIWKRREGIRRVLCPEAFEPLAADPEPELRLAGPPRPKRRRG